MVKFGHDSEFGLSRKGRILSALDVLKPFETESGRGFPDNMNAEIAINPVTTLKDLHRYTEDLLNQVRDRGFSLVMEPSIKYPDEAMQNPLAYISGCNPDFNAYSGTENKSPDFKEVDSVRSCGAHVHVGGSEVDPSSLTRWLDLYLGVPLLLLEPPNTRRSLYGQAGCLRYKPYGPEYRTLSNVWIGQDHTREFVWDGVFKAIEQAKKHDLRDQDGWVDVPTAIDTHDITLAKDVISRFNHLGVQAA